ncbi:MAG: DUF2332 family protein [Pseudomonadota bacterium]
MALNPLPDPIAAAFAQQARACDALGSPFTASICHIIAARGLPKGDTQARIAAWQGDPHGTGTAVALRLTGALHNLVLTQVADKLKTVYPPHQPSDTELETAIFDAIERHDEAICAFLDSPPQTNETGRSAALLPALLLLAKRHNLPMNLLELGASAGLNQNLARFHYDYADWQWGDAGSPLNLKCEWRGARYPHPEEKLQIASSAGCDIAPVAIETNEDQLHLMSYVWADQTERTRRIKAALQLAKLDPPIVEKSGAADWLAAKLKEPQPVGNWRVIFHTIMWQYMPAEEQQRAKSLIQQAGTRASAKSPMGWVRLEADGERGSAGLYSTIWDGSSQDGKDQLLARGDFHGRWIEWLN